MKHIKLFESFSEQDSKPSLFSKLYSKLPSLPRNQVILITFEDRCYVGVVSQSFVDKCGEMIQGFRMEDPSSVEMTNMVSFKYTGQKYLTVSTEPISEKSFQDMNQGQEEYYYTLDNNHIDAEGDKGLIIYHAPIINDGNLYMNEIVKDNNYSIPSGDMNKKTQPEILKLLMFRFRRKALRK
jgi:hypothetical protein